MTTDAQNIAICKVLGREWHRPTPEEMASGSYYSYHPDFTRCLNDMHAAEKSLGSCKNWDSYVEELTKLNPNIVSATASQKSEAFLRSLNLWRKNE